MKTPKDNAFARDKAWLRQQVRASFIDPPMVLEAYGGFGVLWQYAWRDCRGTVFDKDEGKCEHLAAQRPEWSVYCGDSEKLIANGLPVHQMIDVLDVDPWGDPWPVIKGFLAAKRSFASEMSVVVHDGLRQFARLRKGWQSESLKPIAARWGTEAIYDRYLEACRELMKDAAVGAVYDVESFKGFYSGGGNHAHYWARLKLRADSVRTPS